MPFLLKARTSPKKIGLDVFFFWQPFLSFSQVSGIPSFEPFGMVLLNVYAKEGYLKLALHSLICIIVQ
jgi:hypothetical protein